LEAAHLRPYRGEGDNHPSNGLLLRSDLHTLFDLGLIGINPEDHTIVIHPALRGTEYEQYDGKGL
jgi:predicted restriction endonuclease